MLNKLKICWEDLRNKNTDFEFNEQYVEEYETLTIKEALYIYMKEDMKQTNDHQIVSVFLNGKQIY